MRKITILIGFIIVCFVSNFLTAQTIVINTSFDDYSVGNLSGQSLWSMEESGSALVSDSIVCIHSGTQGILLSDSTGTADVELNHVAYDDESTGIYDVVYMDLWAKLVQSNSSTIKISAYDLLPGGERRACEFLIKSGGDLKLECSGGVYASDILDYDLTEWTRISAKVNFPDSTVEAAVNGVILYGDDDTELTSFVFREDYSAIDKGRNTSNKEYHSLRISYSEDACVLAFDDMYIGTNAISDIEFPSDESIPTSLSENMTTNRLLVYPNPSVGSFVVANQKGAKLDVMTLDGKIIYSKSNINANEQVTLDAKSGIYLVKVGELVNKIAIK